MSNAEVVAAAAEMPGNRLIVAGLLAVALFSPLGSTIPGLVFLFGAMVLRWLQGKSPLADFPLNRPLLAFVAIAFISSAFAYNKSVAFANAAALLLMVLVAVFGAKGHRVMSTAQWNYFLWAIVVATTICAAYAVVHYFVADTSRTKAVFVGENGLGTLMLFFGTIGVAFFVQRGSRSYGWLGLPFILLVMVALALSGSRGAWVGMGASMVLLLLRPRRDRQGWPVLTVALVGFAALALLAPDVQARIRVLLSLEENLGRLLVWKQSLALVRDHLLVGVGLGNFHEAFAAYESAILDDRGRWGATTPHNLFLTLAAEVGLLGLLSFLYILSVVAKPAIRLWKDGDAVHAALVAAVAGGLVHQFFDHTWHTVHMGFIFWLSICLIAVMGEGVRRQT